ncbi:MAG: phosphodiester glycosidase family protein [Erysipelotrichaceae bacterium]|nr:phosphodiester glycosidase family protein [Erysipelotrichaceae bacterium]
MEENKNLNPENESMEKTKIYKLNDTSAAAEKPVKKKKIRKKRLTWYTKFLLFVDVCAIICFFLVYGPYEGLRDWYVTTALTTGAHKYLAYIFYSDDTINEVLDKNKTIVSGDTTDTSQIKVVDNPDTGYYANEYDRQVLQRESPDQLYKVIEISENGYKGWITVIYYPQRLELVTSGSRYGGTITQYAEKYDAMVAVNGGGYSLFGDNSVASYGSTITEGVIIDDWDKVEEFVAMDWEGRLFLTYATATEVQQAGARWALTFGPFLIVNGEKSTFYGNGGYGVQPRTAIGQRKDGVVLLVTIDGRGSGGSEGATMTELADLFERYGAYNAANLDGGGSSMLAIEKELINHPAGWNYTGERYVYDAIIYR